MSKKRGRPPLVDNSELVDVFIRFKENLFTDEFKFVSKQDPVWKQIEKSLASKYKASTLYTFATCNRHKIRDQFEKLGLLPQSTPIVCELNESEVNLSLGSSINSEEDTSDAKIRKFQIPVPVNEFEKIFEEETCARPSRNKKKIHSRTRRVFIAGIWQDFITKQIFNSSRLRCGFNFDSSYLSTNEIRGTIQGHCNCGSKLTIKIEPGTYKDTVFLNCTVICGAGKCGKRYLRQPIRDEVCKELTRKNTEVYQAEKADELMMPGDPEPPHLFSSEVLNTAKSEYLKKQYLDPDPVKALQIMKHGDYENRIGDVGLDPFFVQYGSNQQLQAYKKMCSAGIVTVYIDSTGKVVRKIKKPNNRESKHVFLHIVVVNGPAGQFPIAQMLSEESHTVALCNWLKMLIRSGAPIPRECVTDMSKALLNAVTQAFTQYQTVEDYAEACRKNVARRCSIRVDNAHFLKKYSVFLKTLPRATKCFYLACLGQLIKCTHDSEAEKILTAIFLVSQSEKEGIPSNEPTACQKAIEDLERRTTGYEQDKEIQDIVDEEPSNDSRVDYDTQNCAISENSWALWAKDINSSVLPIAEANVVGRINGYFVHNVNLTKYIIKDMSLFPLWSGVCLEQVGYGRNPASSAAVEGEFNLIKNRVFEHENLPIRADLFVAKHLDYLKGKMKPVESRLDDRDTSNDNATELDSSYHGNDSSMLNDISSSSQDVEENLAHETCEKSEEIEVHETAGNDRCYACANGHCPGDAHKCAICQTPVHIFDECSKPCEGEDEGYGQKRICVSCFNAGSAKETLALREYDNWRNLGSQNEKTNKTTKKGSSQVGAKRKRSKLSISGKSKLQRKQKNRQALYLGQSKSILKDMITLGRHSKIPVIKNGNRIGAAALTIENKNISLENTCAFDSIFQLLLIACHDYPIVAQKVENLSEEDEFFKMVQETKVSGLGSQTYRARVKLLSKFHELCKSETYTNLHVLKCATSVGSEAKKLFRKCPSFIEISTCKSGCTPREKPLTAYGLMDFVLLDDDADQIVQNYVKSTMHTSCLECCGEEDTELFVEDIVIFDIILEGTTTAMELENLPKCLKIPGTEKESLRLHGLVNFKGRTVQTRTELGHYTAICFRRGNHSWFEYNDSDGTTTRLSGKEKVKPALIIYIKDKM